jgi:opacity protein-like surface antigen
MKKLMTMAGAAVLAASVAGAAFAQANPNAPQPNSNGTGVYAPGTSPTGEAVDTPQNNGRSRATTTTGSSTGKETKSMNKGMKKDSGQ